MFDEVDRSVGHLSASSINIVHLSTLCVENGLALIQCVGRVPAEVDSTKTEGGTWQNDC